MKKAGIITFQESYNFGALLQAYALKRKIEDLGHSADIVNYHSAEKAGQYDIGISAGKGLSGKVKRLLSFCIRKKRKERFDSFRREQLGLAVPQYDHETVRQLNDRYDLFICGSDQVWNPKSIKHDAAYFLDFVDDRSKCASYAPSFGLSTVPDEYLKMVTDGIEHMSRLSVREESGKDIVKQLTGKEAEVVLDPTLLLSEDEWNGLAGQRKVKERYIFLYMVGFSQKAVDLAKELSKKTGMKVVMPVKTVKDYGYGFRCFNGGPLEFLNMIRYSDYVITTSFHGMMFSLIFKKKFFEVEKPAENSDTASRIDDFLDSLGIRNRKYSGDIDVIDDIDYDEVGRRLGELRTVSEDYLKRCFGDID